MDFDTWKQGCCCKKDLKMWKWLWNRVVDIGWENFEEHDRKSLDCLETAEKGILVIQWQKTQLNYVLQLCGKQNL